MEDLFVLTLLQHVGEVEESLAVGQHPVDIDDLHSHLRLEDGFTTNASLRKFAHYLYLAVLFGWIVAVQSESDHFDVVGPLNILDLACEHILANAFVQKTEEGETVLNYKLLGALQGRKDAVSKQIKKLTPPVTKGLEVPSTGPALATQRRVRRPSKIIYVHYGLQSAS